MARLLFKMNNKGYAQIVGLAIFLLALYIVIFVIIPQVTPPATFQIQLQNQQLSKPQEGVLFYAITNTRDITLTNVKINNSIIGYENIFRDTNSLTNILPKSTRSDKFVFNTAYLQPGEYTARSVLTYDYFDKFSNKIKNYTAELTLNFKVY